MKLRCPQCGAETIGGTRSCLSCGAKLSPDSSTSETELRPQARAGVGPGSTVAGRYRILAELGRGGMGVVYRAEDLRLGRQVAVKLLRPELTDKAPARERFLREARAAAAIDHPSICTVYEIEDTDQGGMLISMPCYEGESLRERIARGPLEIADAVALGIQVARGLEKAHQRGLIHRDIKPGNILVTAAAEAKILDFGLAKPDGETTLTQTGTLLGTVAYMSPEQAQGEAVDRTTDLWSLGIVLFEMLTARRPFEGEGEQSILASILVKPHPKLRGLRSEVPAELDAVIDKALCKDRRSRYQSAGELADALSVIQNRLIEARSASYERRPSIAVLPFANLSADPEQEYFCDGMAEEILNALTHVDGLRVVARTSSFAFKNTLTDIREIGARLNVECLLEGSVRRAGERLRITAQLVNVADGYHIWSERYERNLEDVFAIQDEIALAIVDALKVTLLAPQKDAMQRPRTVSLEAYNLHLRGMYHWNRLTPESYARCLECLEEAIRIDPGFAPAYVWLGVWHLSQVFWANRSPREGLRATLKVIHRALELDPNHPIAHSGLGVVSGFFERDTAGAERHLFRSIHLGPSVSYCHANLGAYMLVRRRYAELEEQARLTLELDPLSSATSAWACCWLAHAGRHDEALAGLDRAIQLDPHQWMPHYQLSETCLVLGGRLDQAVAAAEKAVELSGGASVTVGHLAGLYYKAGRTADGDAQRQVLEEQASRMYVSTSFLAWVSLARGDFDEAMSLLERAADEQDPWVTFSFHMATLLSDDPRLPRAIADLKLWK